MREDEQKECQVDNFRYSDNHVTMNPLTKHVFAGELVHHGRHHNI